MGGRDDGESWCGGTDYRPMSDRDQSDDRERLAALLTEAAEIRGVFRLHIHDIAFMADHLIAAGVTMPAPKLECHCDCGECFGGAGY